MTVMKVMMEHAGKPGTENSCKRCSQGGGVVHTCNTFSQRLFYTINNPSPAKVSSTERFYRPNLAPCPAYIMFYICTSTITYAVMSSL